MSKERLFSGLTSYCGYTALQDLRDPWDLPFDGTEGVSETIVVRPDPSVGTSSDLDSDTLSVSVLTPVPHLWVVVRPGRPVPILLVQGPLDREEGRVAPHTIVIEKSSP